MLPSPIHPFLSASIYLAPEITHFYTCSSFPSSVHLFFYPSIQFHISIILLVFFLQSLSYLIPCLSAVLQVLSSHGYKIWACVSANGFPLSPSLLFSSLSSWKPRFLLQLIRRERAGGAAQRRPSLCAHPGPGQRPARGHQRSITQKAAHRELGDITLSRNWLFNGS